MKARDAGIKETPRMSETPEDKSREM